jgi:hypothetical protein
MAETELLRSFRKFSRSGALRDLQSLGPILGNEGSQLVIGAEVNLLVALDVSRRCVELLECRWVRPGSAANVLERGWVPVAWVFLTLFLLRESYVYAEAFAQCFLKSSVGHRAFQCSRRCLLGCGDPRQADGLVGEVLQFLGSTVRHESCIADVLKVHEGTFRVLFTYIARFSSKLRSEIRDDMVTLFYSLTWGKNAVPPNTSIHEAEQGAILRLWATNGGLPAFSALFWTTCTGLEPGVFSDDLTNLNICVMGFLARLQSGKDVPLVQQTLSEWCASEATKRDGMLAGFYALFEASMSSPAHSIRAGCNGIQFGECIALFKQHCSPTTFEQVIKYPYQGSVFSKEHTWLYKCLDATRKLGVAELLSGLISRLSHLVDGIPWATDAIKAFVEQAATRHTNNPEQQCAFPGCHVTYTASCPLRKCNGCKHVRYCCQLHQKEHWPTHKHECRRLAAEGTAIDVAPSILPSSHASEPVINIAPSVLPSAHASEDPVMNIAPSIPSAHASEDPVTEVAPSILPIAHLCAFPDCDVGTVLRPLERCSRCRATYYCGPAHQRAHWPTHKSACVKQPAPAPTSGAGAAPPPPSTSADLV